MWTLPCRLKVGTPFKVKDAPNVLECISRFDSHLRFLIVYLVTYTSYLESAYFVTVPSVPLPRRCPHQRSR